MKFPQLFTARIQEQFPYDYEDFLAHLTDEPISSIRLNSKKTSELDYPTEPIPWCNTGFFLSSRPTFTIDPQFHSGGYYVQEASSMFLSHIFDFLKSDISMDRVLDLCAAPGGKSTLILDHLSPSQYLISNELIENRNAILRENMVKWGVPNFVITQNEAKHFGGMKSFFDMILIDAPCSGEGMFRKDPKAIAHWNEQNLQKCSERQEDILNSIWDSLRVGGVLIYSTCTFNPEENERLLARLHNQDFLFECIEIPNEPSWNIHTVNYQQVVGYQFLPHKVRGEGFFCSVLRKLSGVEASHSSKPLTPSSTTKPYLMPTFNEYYDELEHNEGLFLAPRVALGDISILRKHLYIKQIGIEIGKKSNQSNIAEHGMALLYCLNTSHFNTVELTKYQALQYLSKETFEIKDIEDGIYLATYRGTPLGFLKQFGYRHNNYYPKNWRILMDWKKLVN